MIEVSCDVLVVGGGPGGSAAATVLAQKGWSVLQVEKEQHPRFHIGESLLPCNLPILQRLGVLEKTGALGVIKRGADFPTDGDGYQTFDFARALGDSPAYAFQVKREDFDHMLFENARVNGVDAREQITVESVECTGIDGIRAKARDVAGQPMTIVARYVVDASGRDTLLGNALKLKRKNQRHQSAAIFAHFRDVEQRPGDDAGNVSIYRFDHGWCWFIPLPGGVMSVGCVCRPDYLKQRRVGSEQFLHDTIAQMPQAHRRMQAAVRVDVVRVTGNYSYACSRMAGPGWIMVGDAWAFIDPVFSSGVFLAMHSGTHAADLVDAVLREPHREAALQRDFAQRMQRGVRVFSWFIYRFKSPVMRQLFARPRNLYRVEEGVISMLAGDVFDAAAVMRRVYVFKLIYAITALTRPRLWLAEMLARRRQERAQSNTGSTPADQA
ncbi:MAG: NAD(P)/FAD-dependent oxidoreductase [Dokdonella sp.]